MSGNEGWVRTGRVDTRKVCTSCGARIKYGDPKPNTTWAERLRLSREQRDLLLVAAAEFMETGEGGPVDFIDWIALTVLARENGHVPDHDGGKSRMESGGFGRNYQHRQPDPIPFVELPWTRER